MREYLIEEGKGVLDLRTRGFSREPETIVTEADMATFSKQTTGSKLVAHLRHESFVVSSSRVYSNSSRDELKDSIGHVTTVQRLSWNT